MEIEFECIVQNPVNKKSVLKKYHNTTLYFTVPYSKLGSQKQLNGINYMKCVIGELWLPPPGGDIVCSVVFFIKIYNQKYKCQIIDS